MATPKRQPRALFDVDVLVALLNADHVHHRAASGLLDADRFDSDALLGHRQVTDAWLLGLAVDRGLRLVTLDAAIPWRVVKGARPAHVVTL